MKLANSLFIVLFFILLAIPVAFTERKEGVISDIDNRQLTDFQGIQELSFDGLKQGAENFTSYMSDRIGFRSAMLSAYQRLNTALFRITGHPLYSYGRGGHIFYGIALERLDCEANLAVYADFLADMQAYCHERGAGFYFVLNPSKTLLYSEYLPLGTNYLHVEYNTCGAF